MTKLIPIPCLFALAAALGCGETQDQTIDQLAFDRPVDIAFACHGRMRITSDPLQPTEISAMPTSACELRSQPPVPIPQECQPSGVDITANPTDPRIVKDQPFPQGQEPRSSENCVKVSPVTWYGLILQKGPGTVAIAQFGTKPGATLGSDPDTGLTVHDADPLTPGKNGISVGEDPVAIHTDPAGCHAITANAGSCDLSVLDLNSAFERARSVQVDRLAIKNAAGVPMRARPAAMAGEPSSELIGERCQASPTGLVYVAYPSCHLVAAVETATGTIVAGIQYGSNGVPAVVDGNVTCPNECDGGGAVTPGVRPVTLDLTVDPRSGTRRLAIGADNSAAVTVVDLDTEWRPTTLEQIQLEDPAGTLGVTSISLSPEIDMGGDTAIFDDEGSSSGNLSQFVYATATDGTVRVADVLVEDRECDTQVDARFARAIQDVAELSCLPIGTVSTPRRAGARSPGIHLPGDAIPLSVDIFRASDPLGTRSREAQATLIGYFAVVTATNGSVFVVNVDDDNYADAFRPATPLAAPVQLAMAHQLRDAVGNRHKTIDDEDQQYTETPSSDGMSVTITGDKDDLDCIDAGGVGGPRVAAPPARTPPTGSVAAEKLTQLPGFRQLRCDRSARRKPGAQPNPDDKRAISELLYAAPPEVRDRSFPDLQALPEAETWTMVWEGSLSLNVGTTDVDGPAIREGMLRVNALSMHVLDATKPFCDAGVEPFDILQLRGCDPSTGAADCPTGYTCFVHPESKVQGLGACMLADQADRLANGCKDYLTTLRRYTIHSAASGELVALPRRVQLSTTPLDGCVDDSQCEVLATHAARLPSGKHPCGDGVCDLGRESAASCAADCNGKPTCGDQACDSEGGETAANCAADCDGRTWACVADPLRAPMGGTGKRCELRCDTSADCLTGTICQGALPGQAKSGFCMEGVIPPQACIDASQRYELHAGEAFAVVGSVSGFVHPIIENAAGQCVRDPMASHLSIGRLPLMPHDPLAPSTLQMCDPAADPITGKTAGGAFEPNPCFTTVPHTWAKPNLDAACVQAGEELVERQAPAVRFRNRGLTFTIVDPYYPGDAKCITDAAGNLGQIPHVVPGLALSFRQISGFVPLRLFSASATDQPSFPVKVVRGPSDSIWVVDEGDFLSSSASQASTRGKVLRVHPAALGVVSVLR